MSLNTHVKDSYFTVNAWKLTILSPLYRLNGFFNKKNCCTFQGVYGKMTYNYEENEFIGDIAYVTSNTIMAADGPSQRSDEAFVFKI